MYSIFPISIVIGTIIGGTCLDGYGGKRIIYYFCIAFFIFVDNWQNFAMVYAFVGLFQGTGLYLTFATLDMDITNPKIGATQYSIFA